MLDNFELCKVEITKVCTDGDLNEAETGFTFSFEGTVTNGGFGTIHDVVVTDDNGTPADTGDDFVVANFDSIPKGGVENYTGSFEYAGNAPTNGISVKAASSDGGLQSITASTTALCPTVAKTPGIDVTKSCETRVVLDANKLIVRVDFKGDVCNTTGKDGVPPVGLYNVVLTDQVGNGTPVTIKTIDTLAANTCASYEGSYVPSSAGSTLPSDISFSDIVKATGEPPAVLNMVAVSDTATATCPLCPTCPDCPTPSP